MEIRAHRTPSPHAAGTIVAISHDFCHNEVRSTKEQASLKGCQPSHAHIVMLRNIRNSLISGRCERMIQDEIALDNQRPEQFYAAFARHDIKTRTIQRNNAMKATGLPMEPVVFVFFCCHLLF